jgi:hypothetical protein
MIREGAMKHTNVRAVLYGGRYRLKELLATNEGEGTAAGAETRRRRGAAGVGELQVAD